MPCGTVRSTEATSRTGAACVCGLAASLMGSVSTGCEAQVQGVDGRPRQPTIRSASRRARATGGGRTDLLMGRRLDDLGRLGRRLVVLVGGVARVLVVVGVGHGWGCCWRWVSGGSLR